MSTLIKNLETAQKEYQEKMLDEFKSTLEKSMKEILESQIKTQYNKIKDQHCEYKGLYGYEGLDLKSFDELWGIWGALHGDVFYSMDGKERKFFNINNLRSAYSDEKWILLTRGSHGQHIHVVSTRGKYARFEKPNHPKDKKYIFVVDLEFRIPRSYIRCLTLHTYHPDSSCTILDFLKTIKEELSANTTLSPFGETILERCKTLEAENTEQTKEIKDLKYQIESTKNSEEKLKIAMLENIKLQKTIDEMAEKIKMLEKSVPHPPTDIDFPTTMENKA